MERRSGQRSILDYLESTDLLARWLKDRSYLIELNNDDIIELRGFALDGEYDKSIYRGEEALNILKEIAREEYVYERRINADNEERETETEEVGSQEKTGGGLHQRNNQRVDIRWLDGGQGQLWHGED